MLSIDKTLIVSDVKSYIRDNYPVCFTLKDNGSMIATDSFLLEICKAYVKAGFSLRQPYTNYSSSETRTAWSTPYFMKIRQAMTNHESHFTGSLGYRWRDVIWMVCCAINKRGNAQSDGDYTYPASNKLWRCMQIEDSYLKVVIESLRERENRESGQRQAEQNRINRESQAARDAAARAIDAADRTREQVTNESEIENIPYPDNVVKKLLPIFAAGVVGFFLLK